MKKTWRRCGKRCETDFEKASHDAVGEMLYPYRCEDTSSRTDLNDDVVDVTSMSVLDVVEMNHCEDIWFKRVKGSSYSMQLAQGPRHTKL